MIQTATRTLPLVISLSLYSGAALGQEVEIYIPNLHTKVADVSETNNILARCLATGLKEYCVGISFGQDGATFESNGTSEITLETFVIDLNDDNETEKPNVTVKNDEDEDIGQNAASTDVKSAGIEIEFDFNSHKLRADQLDKVSALATAFADEINIGKLYAIVGHTDGKGSDSYNCKLSEKRATTITSALLVGGAKANLQPIGAGEALLKDVANPANAQNRRVSFLKLDDNAETVISAFKALCY
ncbi:OmpA family protein [Planktomarina temperata]|nr:OmpA family protein [Planktomarina temperata]